MGLLNLINKYIFYIIIGIILFLILNKDKEQNDNNIVEQCVDVEQYFLVVLDAGHGYRNNKCDYKAVVDGIDCFYEWEFNLDVVNRIAKKLDDLGILYVRTDTKTDQRDMSINDRINFINSLSENYANEYKKNYPNSLKNSGKILVLSVHGNASSNKNAAGFEIYSTANKSKILNDDEYEKNIIYIASLLKEEYQRMFPNTPFRERGGRPFIESHRAKARQIGIVKYTNAYSILTENGFYTNPAERELMKSDEYKDMIADVHVNFIMRMIKH